MPTIGQRITSARKPPIQTHLVSRVKIAQHLGLDPGTIKNWENDVHVPRADQLSAIAKFLEVDLRYLAGIIEEPRPDASREADASTDPDALEIAKAGLEAIGAAARQQAPAPKPRKRSVRKAGPSSA